MKRLILSTLLIIIALPAHAANWDESINGELSGDPGAPTAVSMEAGLTIIWATMGNGDRDYITFSVPAGHTLLTIGLGIFYPDDIAFAAINSGNTSFIPSSGTSANFLSGIHITAADFDHDLLDYFMTRSVTTNSLPSSSLGPGTYCFLIQQTSAVTQTYGLVFSIAGPVPVTPSTWGSVKALYR